MARIVLIEDNETERSLLVQMLGMLGHEVISEANGSAGFKRVQETLPEVLITDLYIPGKDGMQIIIEVCRNFPQIKIIAISGGGFGGKNDQLKMAKICGAHQTLAKPFTQEELRNALQAVLNAPSPADT